jgi:putative phosphoesterase
MKILVFSDSHAYKDAMLKATEREAPNVIVHCGDHNRDTQSLELGYPKTPIHAVRGNCDRTSSGKDNLEIMISGKRFFITHGHLYGVKMGLRELTREAQLRGVDAVLFGHTHIQHHSVTDELILVNPGSIGAGGKTYAVLDIKNGEINVELRNV